MAEAVEESRRRAERARRTGLFRYQLIQDVTDPGLSARQRGALVRELAGREHDGPAGQKIAVSAQTIRRWARDWRAGGFEALVPAPARVSARTPAEVLELAVALKKENPLRTAAQVTRILRAQAGWAPSDRTVQRHFERLELNRPAAVAGPAAGVFGRFEAGRPNEIRAGDALHGPVIAGRKTYLFAFIDDHSRAVMAARFGFSEDTVRLAAALRPALASRGVPESAFVDNGRAFVDSWLLRACAVLGIKLIHSTPRRPQGKGEIERFFRTVRGQFLPDPTVGVRGIHHAIVTALGGRPAHGTAALTAQAAGALATEQAERGRTPVLAIDEAHLLQADQLESIRMLTNHAMDSAAMFACLLIGQPTLRRRLKLGQLAALDQRIAVRYHMTGMTTAETTSYLRRHLALAGRSDTLFSDDAAALIRQTSRGYPRAASNLAIASLLAAFTAGKAIADESSARAAVTEVTTE